MKIVKIKEEHYRAPLSWITKCTEQEFFDLLKRLEIETEWDLGGDGHFIYGNGYSLIWINEGLKPDEFLRTLNHELLHYCIGTLYRKGIPISYENEEAIAYFQEKMLKKCMAVDLRTKKKK